MRLVYRRESCVVKPNNLTISCHSKIPCESGGGGRGGGAGGAGSLAPPPLAKRKSGADDPPTQLGIQQWIS